MGIERSDKTDSPDAGRISEGAPRAAQAGGRAGPCVSGQLASSRSRRAVRWIDLVICAVFAALMLASSPIQVWTTTEFNATDEGQHFYALTRVAAGQTLYADFYYLYGPSMLYSLAVWFALLGRNLAAVLFAMRIAAPVLSLLVVFVIGRCCLRRTWWRGALLLAVLLANAQVVFWCPAYRVWTSLAGLMGLAVALFHRRPWACALWGAVVGVGFNMSADVAVMTIAGGVVLAAGTLAAQGGRATLRHGALGGAGFVAACALLWLPTLLAGGLAQAWVFTRGILSGTNWYAGYALPWPWWVWTGHASQVVGVLKIYGYFAALLACVVGVVAWAIRRRRARRRVLTLRFVQSATLLACAAVLARVVLGRTSTWDLWRLGLASAPLFVLVAIFAERSQGSLRRRLSRRRFFGAPRAGRAALASLTGLVLLTGVIVYPKTPFKSCVVAVKAGLAQLSLAEAESSTYDAIRQGVPTREVSGIRVVEGSNDTVWADYAPAVAWLRERMRPEDTLYVCPWGPHAAFLGRPNPLRTDILDNVVASRELRARFTADLEHQRPTYVIMSKAVALGRTGFATSYSSSGNPELATRTVRLFLERWYDPVVDLGRDRIFRRRPAPHPAFDPRPVCSWATLDALGGKWISGTVRGNRLTDVGRKLFFEGPVQLAEPVDLVEVKLALEYGPGMAGLAIPAVRCVCHKQGRVVSSVTLTVPTDGRECALRFYTERPILPDTITLRLSHDGPFNPTPRAVRFAGMTLYRVDGRAFE